MAMLPSNHTRRNALKSALAFTGAFVLNRSGRASGFQAANDRPRVGAIGTGSRWYQKATGLNGPHGSAPDFKNYGDYIAVCDADSFRRELAAGLVKEWTRQQPYKNRPHVDHFRNFVEAARDKKEPISDVFSHHRALSTCHLAGIAARLNRKITWDPQKEMIVGDDQAHGFVSREYRKGFEIG